MGLIIWGERTGHQDDFISGMFTIAGISPCSIGNRYIFNPGPAIPASELLVYQRVHFVSIVLVANAYKRTFAASMIHTMLFLHFGGQQNEKRIGFLEVPNVGSFRGNLR